MILATILLAIITVELRNLLRASLSLCGTCTTMGALFWLLNAPYVAIFQLLIYAGAVVVLFLAVVMLTTKGEEHQYD
ncbi:MAG: NADH-quinone oxidoreductase subunit J [Candidatus Bathyarchaeota archaeon]